jgi:hypothetical protein
VIVSESSASALEADGSTKAEISVFLFGKPPANVSFGTQVVSRVCCDSSGVPAACVNPAPLRVTPVAELVAGNKVTVTATTETLMGTTNLNVWIVSAVPSAPFAEVPCTAPDGKTSSAVQLTLRPAM